MSFDIGPRILVKGEKEFNSSIKSIDQSFKTLSSEMQLVETKFAGNEKSTESLSAKNQVLTKQIENQKERLSALSTQYQKQLDILRQLEKAAQQAADAYGENSKEADKANEALKNQKNILSSLQTGINNTTANIEKMEREIVNLSDSLKRASDGFKEFGDKLESGGRKMMPATLAIAGAGAAAFKMAADMEDAMGATDQVFGKSSDSMKEWAKNLEGYYGIAEGEALEHGNIMGAMLQNIGGLTEEEAAKQSQTLIELAGDLSAMFGGSVQDAVHALTGALKGNNSMLDNYGMGVNEATIKTKALEMGLSDGKKEMSLATKQAATLALIMEQSADAQGQAARESDGASGSMKEFNKEIKDFATSFGTVVMPMIIPFIQGLTGMIKKFSELDDGSKKTIVTILGIVAAVGPLLIMAGKVSLAISSILGLAGKLGGLGLISSLSSAATAVGGVVAAIGIVPIAIAAAILAVGLFGDEIKAGLLKADSFMQNIFAKDWTETFGAAGEVVNAFFKNFKGVWDALVKFVVGIIDFIRGVFTGDWKRAWGGLADAVTAIFDGMAAGLKAPINGIIGFINMMIDGINQMIRGMNKLKFDIPDWVPIIGGKEFKINISEIGKIPLLATGGYLSSGSAIVGEAGAELLTMMGNKAKVTPLTNGGKPPIAPAYQIGEVIINPNAQQWNELMTLLQQSRVAQQQRRAWG